ncbi:MAG: CDP-glucose 4,6-dehydratase [Bacteroidota bacterium]
MKLQQFYRGKRVLVTGHTGFKGAWLSLWLTKMGAEVYGYALDPLQQNGVFDLCGLERKMKDFRGDVRDSEKFGNYLLSCSPELVFHLAAQPLVLESYRDPRTTFDTNVMGTVNLLDAIRHCPTVKAAVIITSDKCYENQERIRGYREDDPMGGHDPYSASKGAAELVVSSFRRSFFSAPGTAAIASARAGNVIGGGDWSENRLIPDTFRALEKGEVIRLRNPHAVRPWQHVLEPLRAYLMLGEALVREPEKFAGAWNFGPEEEDIHTVAEVVSALIEQAGTGHWLSAAEPGQAHEAGLLTLDTEKARHLLNWKPLLSFRETISMTADWYLHYMKGHASELTESQLDKYLEQWNSERED